MMTQAFYTGISGLRSNQVGIDVVSDNLANTNTIGFRGSEYEFTSLFESAINSSSAATSNTIGVGSRLQATTLKEDQGSFQLTDRSTDLAIEGDGWFGVEGQTYTSYTRDGAFTFDGDNNLVNAAGFGVLGTQGTNIAGEVLTAVLAEVPLGDATAQTKLRFPKFLEYPPEATTTAKFIGNIGTESATRTIGAGVIDSLGVKNQLKLTFSQVSPQVLPGSQWNVVATTETIDGNTVYDTQNGVMTFTAAGGLDTSTFTTIDNNGSPVTINPGTGFDGVTAISNTNISASSISDGVIGGQLVGYSINKNSEVIATFNNGRQSSVGKIGVFHFQNNRGLERLGGTGFLETQNSGEPFFYQDANGVNISGSDVANFKLENSNIDISYGLTELIILQRAYDANSKSISTADQMMQKALNMDA